LDESALPANFDELASAMVQHYIQHTITVRDTDEAKAEAAIERLYRALGHEVQKAIWFDSPVALVKFLAESMKCKPSEAARYYCDGQFSAWWFARFEFAIKYVKGYNEERELTEAMVDVGRECAGYILCKEAVLLARHPIEIHVNPEHRPHNEDGASILYRDGSGIYCVNGRRVPKKWIMNKDKLSPKDVDDETNAELRVILLQLYGMGRYIADSKSELVHEVPAEVKGKKYTAVRPDTGKVYNYGLRGARLWRRQNGHGDVIQAVELLNSTWVVGEKRKTYYIGVSVQATTVEQAVALSYGFDKSVMYDPAIET
jgi:hypothetical protein